jgi:hypothetical protein
MSEQALRNKKEINLEIERFDKELVQKKVDEIVDDIEKLGKEIASKTWELGKKLYDATEDMTKREKSYFYALIKEKLGYHPGYLRCAKLFYSRFPDINWFLDRGIKIKFLDYLSKIDEKLFRNIVITIRNNWEEVKDCSWRDFKNWLRDNFGLKGKFIIPKSCAICEAEIPLEYFDEMAEQGCWHKDCFDNLKRMASENKGTEEKLQEELKEKNRIIDGLRKDWDRCWNNPEMLKKRLEYLTKNVE